MQRTVCAAGLAALCLAWAASAAAQATGTGHLACYKVKDSQVKATYKANVGGLAVQAGCIIKVPAAIACVPASKTSVSPTPPGGGGIGTPNSFTCYKVKCPKATFSSFTADDQFGNRAVTVKSTTLVCAPNAGPTDGGFPATGETMAVTATKDGGSSQVPVQADGSVRAGAPLRYNDNGDGTVTDLNTGLMWEKKEETNSDGTPNYADLHDVNNSYVWDNSGSGVGIWTWLDQLNAANFAGHSDWRIPNVKELVSILDYGGSNTAFEANCAAGCSIERGITECSCTEFAQYWSSTWRSYGGSGAVSFAVDFEGDTVEAHFNREFLWIRAVRNGS